MYYIGSAPLPYTSKVDNKPKWINKGDLLVLDTDAVTRSVSLSPIILESSSFRLQVQGVSHAIVNEKNALYRVKVPLGTEERKYTWKSSRRASGKHELDAA